jgi:hypothetical protein
MIINNRVSGPSYSTDSTASNLAGFLRSAAYEPSTRREPVTYTGRVEFADLYPSIFAEDVPAQNVFAALAEACGRLGATVKAGLVSLRGRVLHY